MAAWLPADLPLSLRYESREGGVFAKHWVTLLTQLLLILVGFWVGIRIDTTHFPRNFFKFTKICVLSETTIWEHIKYGMKIQPQTQRTIPTWLDGLDQTMLNYQLDLITKTQNYQHNLNQMKL